MGERIKIRESESERLREVSYLNKENKGLHKVVEVMQRADRVEKFLKGLSFWDKFRIVISNADFEQGIKSFNHPT